MFFSIFAQAELLDEVFSDYCSPEYYDCSQASQDIVKNYFAAGAPVASLDETLYAGSCYMVSSSYNKDHEHFGYLYFRQREGKLDFFGAFSYFFEENPYLNMTIAEARALNPDNSQYQILEIAEHWRVDTNIDPPWQYFMRESNSKLYVIGFWGIDDSITCELIKK